MKNVINKHSYFAHLIYIHKNLLYLLSRDIESLQFLNFGH